MTRTFEDKPAVRSKVPLLAGIMGPSGGGKTYSALRLATGFQRVSGGDIFCIDTEARRALHYADRFKFRHVEFGAPFGPLDFLSAIEHCVKKGAGVIVVDNMSHEHEGPGGLLEMHAEALDRMAGNDYKKRAKMTMLAWQKPKADRRRLINTVLQLPVNFIFCFRAKEKVKMVKGEDPKQMGFMPIAGDEFVYEMTVNCLLLPNAGGVPTWRSDEIGERLAMKLPEQFKPLFAKQQPLSEDIGEAMARWAAGETLQAQARDVLGDVAASIVRSANNTADQSVIHGLKERATKAWPSLSRDERRAVTGAIKHAESRATTPTDDEPLAEPPDDWEPENEAAQ